MNQVDAATDSRYQQALATVQRAVEKLRGCPPEEKDKLRQDLVQLREMEQKLTQGRVEIVLFGEISTGKSALINALVGEPLAEVDVQGGWTKEAHTVPWKETDYVIPGLDGSHLVLVDTPGINEVGNLGHETIARHAARRGDLILFVADSDLDETEFSAIVALASVNKPILFVLNKIDLYAPEELEPVGDPPARPPAARHRRAGKLRAHQRRSARDRIRDAQQPPVAKPSEWRKPQPKVAELKARILEVLERDGIALDCAERGDVRRRQDGPDRPPAHPAA